MDSRDASGISWNLLGRHETRKGASAWAGHVHPFMSRIFQGIFQDVTLALCFVTYSARRTSTELNTLSCHCKVWTAAEIDCHLSIFETMCLKVFQIRLACRKKKYHSFSPWERPKHRLSQREKQNFSVTAAFKLVAKLYSLQVFLFSFPLGNYI